MPTRTLDFPLRTVHLDFHTGPHIPDVARDFDADAFAERFAEARVDSVTVFGLCHHGHAYFRTSHPCRHPSLPADLDLTGAQIDALHRRGIRAPIYLSAQVNEYAANEHPEWLAIDPDGRRVKRLPADPPPQPPEALNAGWQILDMSSPYQDYLAELVEEVLRRYAPVDGIFLDMCWDQPSISPWALAGMAKRRLDPRSAADRDRYAREVALAYMKRFAGMVEAAGRGGDHLGIWFNSRPKTNLHVEKRFLRHIEIEALPTGGWGYAYFPYVARFVRPLGLPTLSHTGRFFKSWGDNAGLKPHAALKYECCQILSQGMALGVGDLLHPRGAPDPAVYDLIGSVYRYIERCQEVAAGGRLQSEIAVVVDPELGDRPGPAGLGTTRALQQLRLQFDILPPAARLDGYPVVVVLSNTPVDDAFRAALRDYVAGGGSLMLCGTAALDPEGTPLLAEQGIEACGPSPYGNIFLRPARAVSDGMSDFDHALYESGFRMVPAGGARSLVRVVEPYFERSHDRFSGHSYTPPGRLSRYSAIVLNRLEGGGAVITSIGATVRRLRAARRPRAPAADRQLPGVAAPAPAGARAGSAKRAGDHGDEEGGGHHRASVELRPRTARRPGHRRGRPAAGGPADLHSHGPPAQARRARPARRAARPRVPRRLRHRACHPARRPRHAGVPMITMRSDWWNADSYYPWIDPLVEAAFGAEIDLHWDLYLQTHAHRLQHGPGCEAYPSPPSRAPLWAILAGQMPSPPEVILETGTGIGYSTVLIAEAFPRSRLFTVERDALHRRIAEQTFVDAGLADRITIVPSMDEAPIERSDLVFVDGPVVEPARLRKGLPADRRCREADLPQRRDRCPAAAARPDRRHRRVSTVCSTTLPGRLG